MWKFEALLSDRQQDKIVGNIFNIAIDGEVIVRKVFDIWEDPTDVTWHNGQCYISKPPKWEADMEQWLREQKEFATTFAEPREYAEYMRTVIALED